MFYNTRQYMAEANRYYTKKGHRVITAKTSEISTTSTTSTPASAELILIVSMMMSLTALSIDSMLPALPQIGQALNIVNPNDRQLIISVIFFGLAVGQLFFGPLSDKVGRKPAIFAGYALYIVGAFISALAGSFPMMLIGRTLQGVGVSAPRAVSMAMIRDRFEGRRMAQIMSFAMAIFILVPMIAPTLGQGIMAVAGWRSIFGASLVFALITVGWFAVRIPESLAPENRKPFSVGRILASIGEILKIRMSVGYILTAGLVYGAFTGYLNSAQQIFQEQYALGDQFPLFFATIALSMGVASIANTRLVIRYGMSRLVQWALAAVFGLVAAFLVVASLTAGQPPLWVLMAFLMPIFFCIGIIFGNVNALAMHPLGHMAGVGAAVVGAATTLFSTPLGIVIGRSYDGSILPLVVGMVILTGLANLAVRWTVAQSA